MKRKLSTKSYLLRENDETKHIFINEDLNTAQGREAYQLRLQKRHDKTVKNKETEVHNQEQIQTPNENVDTIVLGNVTLSNLTPEGTI